MSRVVPFISNDVLFGFDLPPEVNADLQRAASQVSNRADALEALNAAYQQAPDRVEVLIALCKFHFYQGNIEQAQDLAYQALVKASLQGGFSHDWHILQADSADWNDPRGPGRAFLYSLKALAFIYLRQHDNEEAGHILDSLQRLDPNDQVGANVIRDLLYGLEDENDE
jgi:tetratricopeptide (TPR) repeat protein